MRASYYYYYVFSLLLFYLLLLLLLSKNKIMIANNVTEPRMCACRLLLGIAHLKEGLRLFRHFRQHGIGPTVVQGGAA
jgi:hypothetical protein